METPKLNDVLDELRRVLDIRPDRPDGKEWMTCAEMCKALGIHPAGKNYKKINRAVREGKLDMFQGRQKRYYRLTKGKKK